MNAEKTEEERMSQKYGVLMEKWQNQDANKEKENRWQKANCTTNKKQKKMKWWSWLMRRQGLWWYIYFLDWLIIEWVTTWWSWVDDGDDHGDDNKDGLGKCIGHLRWLKREVVKAEDFICF